MTNKYNKVKYNKKSKLTIKQPKSIVNSKKFINVIETYINKNSELYDIVFDDSNIKLLGSKKMLEDNNLINKESLIIASFIFKFHNNLSSNFIKLINEIAKPVLYIFMLPLVTKNNEYIIKIGYIQLI